MKFNTEELFETKKEEPKKPTVVFCLPGKEFSQGFFNSWTKLLYFLYVNPILDIHIVNYYLSNIAQCRNTILGGKKTSGKYQVLFENEWNYDYIFWIDTDIVFEPQDVARILVKLSSNPDVQVLSGLYPMANNQPVAIKDFSIDHLKEHEVYEHYDMDELLQESVKNEDGLVKVKCPGMGFVAFKKNVFEKIQYPWFENTKIESPHFVDYDFEDVSLFKKLENKNVEVYIDMETIVGHDKVSTIRL